MNPETFYLQMRRLVASMPDLDNGPITHEVDEWLARATALVEVSGNARDAIEIGAAVKLLDSLHARHTYARNIRIVIARVLARAELKAPVEQQGAFIEAGDSLNAFAAVAKVLERTKRDVLMVDAYADFHIITEFAVTAPAGVTVRILGADREARKATLRSAATNWVQQFGAGRPLEVRVAPQAVLHDRLILIDATEAWSAGQSFNGMAQKSHTSIERSDPELSAMKIQAYESIWSSAQPL
ncbi:phosphatidylserine/phosphatidylglycerophosphate/cardiolipin synthase family protein [Pseudorhodoferax sp. Leaf265]|uniref:phosphatidylserine/phosphatidylglycerophosphate/ cardiolipin synthase family protein n=1 Tax=Pseudorhodoferax sp. Leaf265 TaxID=1736315 RepID=UPI0012E98B61|nr:phosphatidylserine/phosphatidylglycerophosphate/cardiolipin synthase family protein [Pseudorhodoferax sp. Leaf265]